MRRWLGLWFVVVLAVAMLGGIWPAHAEVVLVGCDAASVRAAATGERVLVSELTSESRLVWATLYRVWGGGADQVGGWLTPIRPASSAAARQGLALPAENAALYVSEVKLPPGIRMQVGPAAPAFGQPGGWTQIQLLERIPTSAFGPGEALR